MYKQIDVVRKARTAIINTINDLNADQVNEIPSHFNNNIIWNVAHLLVAQDNIFYARSGHPLKNVNQEFFDAYKPGTKPEKLVSPEEIKRIKELLFSSLDQLEKDLELDMFGNYPTWTTRYGVEIGNKNDALTLLAFHDGLHFGVVQAQNKLVRIKKSDL